MIGKAFVAWNERINNRDQIKGKDFINQVNNLYRKYNKSKHFGLIYGNCTIIFIVLLFFFVTPSFSFSFF